MSKRLDLAQRKGTVKRIHVNQHKIRARDADPLTIQTSAGPINAGLVQIDGPSRVVYSPDKPLSCGARLWIETTAPVQIEERTV